MSSTRGRNKFCLSLDDSTGNTSRSTAYLSRWSEVVPPKTALTFAALWDPEEGMVTFSGAELLESESLSGIPPHVFDDDGCSQVVSVNRDTDGATTTENTATLAAFQDAFDAYLHHTPSNSKHHAHAKAGRDTPHGMQTRASSTFDGLDVYSHDVQVKPKRSLQLSCMDLLDVESTFRTPCEFGRLRVGSNVMLDSCRSDSESDSSSGGRLAYLRSRFSTTTTTSTTNHVDALPSTHICETTLIPAWTRQVECVSPTSLAGSWPYLPHRRGLLRKRRPWDGDITPTGTASMPSTPRKLVSKPWIFSSLSSPSSPSPSSPSSCPRYPSAVFSSSASAIEEGQRRGRFPHDTCGSITPVPTPPTTPSKSSRFKLRFTLLPKWKSRRTSSDSDGWVCIEVTPIIQQRYMPDLGQD